MTLAKDPVEILQVKKLLHCVRIEDYEQIKKLCEKGVKYLINYNEPHEGQTALILASIKNNGKMMEFLLELGAQPNVQDLKGRTALMKAAELGNVQAIEILKKAKADATIRDFEGKDVLFYCLLAPTNRHQACMQIILTMQANCNNKNKEGTPVFVEACKEAVERKDLCLLLIQNGSDPSSFEEKSYRSALHYAAACGSVDVCRSILKHGGNPNASDKNKQTPAHEAASNGHFNVLVLLSSYGAHFDVYDSMGNNPIHLAAAANAGQCCRFMATRGCNPKAKNLEGETPKSIAKDKKCKDASKLLRKAEKQYAKLSRQTQESGGVNWSIRLYDYMYEHKDRVKELFAEHDPEQTGKISKETFIEIISQEGFQNLIETEEMNKLILSHEKIKDQIDYELFLVGKKYISKLFLISSFEPKKKKKKGGKGKAKRGKTKIVIPICTLDEGPRTDDGGPPYVFQPRHVHFTDTSRFDRDSPPKHPLQDDSAWYLRHPDREFQHISNATNRGDCNTLLDSFKRGLPVDIRDKYFKTPLMIAASNGDIDTCRFLLECGADVNAFDNFKWTPLHHACNSGHLDIVKLLVEKGSNINALSITQATPLMRAVESSSFLVVEYLIEKGAKVIQENINGKTAYDIAREFADPRVYLAVKTKFDALPKPKDGKKKAKKAKKPEKKKKPKKDGEVEVYKDDFLPPITMMRRASYSNAEALLTQNIFDNTKTIFRPLHVWTEQDTTEKLMEKKEIVRERFGWEIDFEDYKIPLMKNAMKKLDKLET